MAADQEQGEVQAEARKRRDLIAGIVLIAFGLGAAGYALLHYSLGTLWRMGPGMFPTMVGIALTGLGALVLASALLHPAAMPRVEWRQALSVLCSTLAFAFLIEPAGLVPAVVALTAVSALADPKATVIRTVMLAVILSAMAYLVFRVGLGLSIPVFRWSF